MHGCLLTFLPSNPSHGLHGGLLYRECSVLSVLRPPNPFSSLPDMFTRVLLLVDASYLNSVFPSRLNVKIVHARVNRIAYMPADIYKYGKFKHPKEIRVLVLLGPNDKNTPNDEDIYCRIHHQILPPRFVDTSLKRGQSTQVEKSKEDVAKKLLDYEAVSWTWGDQQNTSSVFVDAGKAKGVIQWKTISVRKNLIQVLKRLRRPETSRNLWVDGICIEQEDEYEKDLQVAMMADIYGNATNVCVCLGEHDQESELALKFIRDTISDLGAFEEFTTKKFSEEWKALAALMNRAWFSRRWVIQEISHAQTATVHCGDGHVKWSDFEMAVSLFERDALRISKIFHGDEKAEYDPEFFGVVEAMGATRLVQAKSKLFRRDANNNIVEFRYPLSDLVTEFSSFEANNPHDMIYAVLSLAKETWHRIMAKDDSNIQDEAATAGPSTPLNGSKHSRDTTHTSVLMDNQTSKNTKAPGASDPRKVWKDETAEELPFTLREKALGKSTINVMKQIRETTKNQHKVFVVQYKQDFFDVCKQFLDFALRYATGSNNLDILCRPWAPLVETELPSWIPCVGEAPFEMRPNRYAPGGKQVARKNHDSLVVQSHPGNSNATGYNACRSQKAYNLRFGDKDHEVQKHSLFVEGFIIDEIGPIEIYSQMGNIPPEWFQLAGWYPWDRKGKRDPENHPPENLWRTLVADRGSDGANPKLYYPKAFEYAIDNSTPHAGLETTNLTKRSNPILVEFLKRMLAVVWNRRLFKSARQGLLGLAPKKARAKDGKSIPTD